MSIENIINRIIEDADKEADLILRQAEAEYEDAIKQAEAEAAAIREEIIEKANAQAEAIARQTASRIELERKKALSAAQAKILQDIYGVAEQEILKFPKNRLERLIAAMIASTEARGNEQISFGEPLKKFATRAFINRLNKMLNSGYSLSDEPAADALIELKGRNYRLLIDVKTIIMEHRRELEEKLLNIIGGKSV